MTPPSRPPRALARARRWTAGVLAGATLSATAIGFQLSTASTETTTTTTTTTTDSSSAGGGSRDSTDTPLESTSEDAQTTTSGS